MQSVLMQTSACVLTEGIVVVAVEVVGVGGLLIVRNRAREGFGGLGSVVTFFS